METVMDSTSLEVFLGNRFGIFVHFGLYSVAARHEWVQTLEEIDSETYQLYFENFNPDLLNPKEWAAKLKSYGCKYVILTTKHHEGFCLWDTQYTDFKITNTSYGKDLIRELVDELRKVGIRIGFYYSLIDWHHPDFTIDGYHPLRNRLEAYHENRDMSKYRQYMKDQLTELLTAYGEIDYLFFDFSYESRVWQHSVGKGSIDWGSEALETLILELQPQILINDRLGLGRGIQTPEQFSKSDTSDIPWETVQTLNNSWGYDRDNANFKDSTMVIKQLVDTVSKNGNFVMNIGPTGRGTFDDVSHSILTDVGKWLTVNGISIYNAKASDFTPPKDCRYTQKGNKLYLHLFSWPYRTILLPELGGKVRFARLLSDGSEVRFVERSQISGDRKSTDNLYKEVTEVHLKEAISPETLVLNLPIKQPDKQVTVIELTLKEEGNG